MRVEATLEEWRSLYKIAIKLKELKPWEELYDMDLITIEQLDTDESYMCSIMGKAGECYAIAAYKGVEAINDFFIMANSFEVPGHQLIRYQNNIMCNFGDRSELTTKERNLIKELGLSFRGKNNWIYFRRFERGYAPYMPNREEVIEFTGVLKHVYMAIQELKNGIKVDFDNQKTLMRKFDMDKNKWITCEEDFTIPCVEYEVPVLKDQLLLKKLERQYKNDAVLELDTVYLNSSINDKGYDKPIIPVLLMMADASTGMVLSQNMITPDEDLMGNMIGTVINYINQLGKPEKIVVRDEYIGNILLDICDKIGVDIILSPKLHVIDGFVESIGNYRF